MVTNTATAEGTAQQSIPFGDAAQTLKKISPTDKDWEPPTPDSVRIPAHNNNKINLENYEVGVTLESPENVLKGDEFLWLPPPALTHVQQPSTEGNDRSSLKLISIARPGSLRRGGGGNNSSQVRTRGEGGNDYGVRGNEGEERVAIEITRATPSTVNLINRHLASQEYQEGVNSNMSKGSMEQPQRGFFSDNPACPSMEDGASVGKSRKSRPALELQCDAKIAVLTPLFPLPTLPLQSAQKSDATSARSLSVKNTLRSTEDTDRISTQTTNEPVRKRPRREAAIASAKRTTLAARQPSPFELDELTLASPSLSLGLGSSLSSSSGRRQLDARYQPSNGSDYHPLPSRRGSTKNTKASCAAGGGGGGGTGSQSNRKVSHSLIERRRREKINDCLTTLRAIVPQCREEGEKKFARAKERGRKRGGNGSKKSSWQSHDVNVDGMDAIQDGEEEVGFGNGCSRGGLHKLEILQGTILYIEELEARLDVFETAASRSGSSSSSLSALQAAASSANTNEEFQDLHFTKEEEEDSLVEEEEEGFGRVESHGPELGDATIRRHRLVNEGKVMQMGEEAEQLAVDDADTAAGLLLLKFSTSPELRPVYF